MNFFILQNTQSGKLSMTAKEMKNWVNTVIFFISSNDRTLVDQSAEGLAYFLDRRVFVLSSNHNENLEYIKDSLGTFPIITALSNKQQNARILELAWLCVQKKLAYAFVFDEADTTYPIVRDQSCLIGRKLINYHNLFPTASHVGFVSATEGELSTEKYPECAHAQLLAVRPETEYYRAIHTRDAVLHEIEAEHESNNEYALAVLKANRRHFFQKTAYGFRKIILNSNSQTSDMESIARECVDLGMNAIIFNMNGLTVLRSDRVLPEIHTRGKRFNKLLFDTVETYELDDRPLVIIGRRKVDRGLSFHYAPRDGSRGLVWTDIILGEIADISLAVQKAGRMAGIIAHSPQYSGECHYWAPSSTLDKCITKNRVNDQANLCGGSLSQALQLATSQVDRFTEYITLSDEEMVLHHLGQSHSLSERLEYYSPIGAEVRTEESGFIRSSGNTVRVSGNTFCFYNGLQLDPRADIPYVIQLTPDEMESIMSSVIQRKLVIKELLQRRFSVSIEHYTFLECRVVDQLDFIQESSTCGRKICLPVEEYSLSSGQSIDSFHILLHPMSCSLAMLMWNASKVKPVKRCRYILQRGKYTGLCCGRMCSGERCEEHDEKMDEEYGQPIVAEDEEDIEMELIVNEDGEEEYVFPQKYLPEEDTYMTIVNEDGEEEFVKVN